MEYQKLQLQQMLQDQLNCQACAPCQQKSGIQQLVYRCENLLGTLGVKRGRSNEKLKSRRRMDVLHV